MKSNGRKNGRKAGLLTCSLRPSHIYGHPTSLDIREVFEVTKGGKVPFKMGNGSAKCEMIYADNVAWAHVLAARKLNDRKVAPAGNAYFLTEGQRMSFWDLYGGMLATRGLAFPTLYLPFWLLSIVCFIVEALHSVVGRVTDKFDPTIHYFILHCMCKNYLLSGKKAEEDFGYTPLVPPKEAYRRTLEYIRNDDSLPKK